LPDQIDQCRNKSEDDEISFVRRESERKKERKSQRENQIVTPTFLTWIVVDSTMWGIVGAALYGKILFFFPSSTASPSSLVTTADAAEVGAGVTATVAGREGGRGLWTGGATLESATPHTTDDISLLVTARIRFTPFFSAKSVCGLLLYAVFELMSLWIASSGDMVGCTLTSVVWANAGVTYSPFSPVRSLDTEVCVGGFECISFTDRAEPGTVLLNGGRPGVLFCQLSE
jgi:hypothetical protein